MTTLFCCSAIKPFRPARLTHEAKFVAFKAWASYPAVSSPSSEDGERLRTGAVTVPYAVQLVRQVNYGALESTRYFLPIESEQNFVEVSEADLIEANFQKVNTYKNFRCDDHNKFFEVNIYQKDPVNQHHWRVNLARPGGSIDI